MACGDSRGIGTVVVGMFGLARMSRGSTRWRMEHRVETGMAEAQIGSTSW